MGRHGDAVPSYTDAWRLLRHHPWRWDTANDLAWTHFFLGNLEAAVEWGEQSVRLSGGYLQAHLATAASLAKVGRTAEATAQMQTALSLRPSLSRARVVARVAYRAPEDREALDEAWRIAGMPD
jgi:tetratricopeptide (TPR) repeat protein